jgi:redox-sensitive bicupin YhaK (pirin superfamily)
VSCAYDDDHSDAFSTEARLLAGELQGETGPFKTTSKVQMVDYFYVPRNATILHSVPEEMDNCLVYVYKGSGVVNDEQPMSTHDVVRMNTQQDQGQGKTREHNSRVFSVRSTSSEGLSLMVFSGQLLEQPIAWRGPFVMTTDQEIQQTLRDYHRGKFPVERVAWDYKRIATRPIE